MTERGRGGERERGIEGGRERESESKRERRKKIQIGRRGGAMETRRRIKPEDALDVH